MALEGIQNILLFLDMKQRV